MTHPHTATVTNVVVNQFSPVDLFNYSAIYMHLEQPDGQFVTNLSSITTMKHSPDIPKRIHILILYDFKSN